MPNKKGAPTKPELARFKVLTDIGHSPYAISKITGRDAKTIRRYLLRSDLYQDAEVQKMIATIKAEELTDLTLIGLKARLHLHRLLDRGKVRPIEATAIMDRSFQQRRLLEGSSTNNINIHALIMEIKKARKKADPCKAESD